MPNMFQVLGLQMNAWTHRLLATFISPRDVARQVVKGLDKKIRQCESGLIETKTQFVQLENRRMKYVDDIEDLKSKVLAADKAGRNDLAMEAGAEILKKQKLTANLDIQLNRLDPTIKATSERIKQYRDQKLELETHIEMLATQLSVAQTEQQLALLMSGTGNGVGHVIAELETEADHQQAKAIATHEVIAELSDAALTNKFAQLESINNQAKIEEIVNQITGKSTIQIEVNSSADEMKQK